MTPATGLMRDPTGSMRRVMCRACTEFWWTRAKRFNGRCGPCRRKGKPVKYHPCVESVCVDCGIEVSGEAKRKRCDTCRAERNRRNAMEWYYAKGQAMRTRKGREEARTSE